MVFPAAAPTGGKRRHKHRDTELFPPRITYPPQWTIGRWAALDVLFPRKTPRARPYRAYTGPIECVIRGDSVFLRHPLDHRLWNGGCFGHALLSRGPAVFARRNPHLIPLDSNGAPQDPETVSLMQEECVFLALSFSCLRVFVAPDPRPLNTPVSFPELLRRAADLVPVHVAFSDIANPSLAQSLSLLLRCVVYHHYRSCGWIVKNGLKFGADYGMLF